MKCEHLCKKKSKNSPEHGDIWIWHCFDASSKLWIDFHLGKRTHENAQILVDSVVNKLETAPYLITTDGYYAYEAPLLSVFDVPYVQIVKQREKGRIVDINTVLINEVRFYEAVESISQSKVSLSFNTSFIERFNATIRQCMSRCRRKSYTFSKNIKALETSLQLFKAYYNLVRLHGKSQCATPAMKANLQNRKWTIREMLSYHF